MAYILCMETDTMLPSLLLATARGVGELTSAELEELQAGAFDDAFDAADEEAREALGLGFGA